MILNRLLITAALMLFSMTLTAQKTYLPLTVGTDTIGFFEGNAFDPYKKKYLFKSTQADKFVESHPDLDFEWSTNEPTYELKWNPSSQDYVEYNEGTFTQNGEEISIDRVGELMKQYRVPFYRSRLGGVITQRKNCENEFRRIGIITGTVIGTPISAAGTALFGFITLWALEVGEMGLAVSAGLLTAESGFLTVYSPYLAYVHSTKGRCQNKVDKLCEKLVDKINQAIVRAGPTVQSSNQ